VSRRSAVGLLILALLVGVGRWVRQTVLLGPQGHWNEPGLWAAVLPPTVPAVGEPSPRVLTAPLNINSCSEDSLTLLPGIGPVLARRIATARRDGLHFTTAADLAVIKGIGAATVDRLRPHLTITVQDSLPANMTNQQ